MASAGDGLSRTEQPGRAPNRSSICSSAAALTFIMASRYSSPMASLAPDSLAAEITDGILAAAQRAPLVELTDEERALLADMESRPVRWIAHEQFASKLRPGDDQR